MNYSDDNGPAFPTDSDNHDKFGLSIAEYEQIHYIGSPHFRVYLAALQGACANPSHSPDSANKFAKDVAALWGRDAGAPEP